MQRFLSLAAASITLLIAAPTLAAEDAPATPKDPAKVAAILSVRASDIVLGNPDAPNLLIEYSSLSCTHCATFHNRVLPTLKRDMIDAGELAFINRDFPLNAPALAGAKLVQCAPEDRRAKFQEVLFKLQDKWAFTPNYESALTKIAVAGGVSADDFAACLKDASLEEALLEQRMEAEGHLQIQGTPAFFLNGERFQANLSATSFVAALRAAMAGEAAPEAEEDVD
jgi:protein-disulfide isomerase